MDEMGWMKGERGEAGIPYDEYLSNLRVKRILEPADVIYDGARDNAATGTWYDWISCGLLACLPVSGCFSSRTTRVRRRGRGRQEGVERWAVQGGRR